MTKTVALVTGASKGVGRGAARALGSKGMTVYLTARSEEELNAAAAEVDAAGGKGIAVVCDHGDDAQVKAVIDRIEREQGRLDLLMIAFPYDTPGCETMMLFRDAYLFACDRGSPLARVDSVKSRDIGSQPLMLLEPGHCLHSHALPVLAAIVPSQPLAGADAFAAESVLPQVGGMHTGRQTIGVMGGELQRLAIARMVLAEPKVVILDEATSALDAATEYALHQALNQFLHGRTTLIIAHRLSAVKQADRVLVFDGGSIAEDGGHQELIAEGGLYAKLYGHLQH